VGQAGLLYRPHPAGAAIRQRHCATLPVLPVLKRSSHFSAFQLRIIRNFANNSKIVCNFAAGFKVILS